MELALVKSEEEGEVMTDKFDFGDQLQLAIARMMIEDTGFLSSCLRGGLIPGYFYSEIVANIVHLVIDYFDQYSQAPKFAAIGQLLADALQKGRGRYHKDDTDVYIKTLGSIVQVDVSEGYDEFVKERLNTFVKNRIVYNLTETLLTLRDRNIVDPDKAIGFIRTALSEVEDRTGSQSIESLMEAGEELDFGDTVCRLNINSIDNSLGGGLKVGSFVVIVGYTNIGKSWCAVHIAKLSTRFGNSPLLIDLERSNRVVRLRLRMCFTGMTREQMARSPVETRNLIASSMVRRSNVILVSDDEKHMAVDRLPSLLEEVEEKYGVRPRMVIIDSADDMDAPGGHQYRFKIDKTTEIYTYLKNFAKDEANDVCVVSTTQAQRRGETVQWISAGTVGDDINKIRKATVGISINARPAEVAKGFVRFYLFKNSDGPVGAKAWAKTGYEKGQLFTQVEAYKHLVYDELLKLAASKKVRKSE